MRGLRNGSSPTGRLFRLPLDDTTIDERRLSGHVVRVGPSPIGNEGGDILRRFGVSQSSALFLVCCSDLGAGDLGKPPIDLNPHVGSDDTGTISVDRDPVSRKFLCRRLSQAADGELRCRPAGGIRKVLGRYSPRQKRS